LSSFLKCTSSDKVRFFCWLDFEWFLFSEIISILLAFSFRIVSSVIFQTIAFDSCFLSWKLSLCHRHRKRELINHWQISNSFLRSTADSNLLESWLNFDIKESRLALICIESYSIFNSNRIEKIRSNIHCIASHQSHYWWKHWSHRTVKFSNQRQSRWSLEHETSLQSAWSHKCSDSWIEDYLWHIIVSWISSDSRRCQICIWTLRSEKYVIDSLFRLTKKCLSFSIRKISLRDHLKFLRKSMSQHLFSVSWFDEQIISMQLRNFRFFLIRTF
jgi:hypothetical protein